MIKKSFASKSKSDEIVINPLICLIVGNIFNASNTKKIVFDSPVQIPSIHI